MFCFALEEYIFSVSKSIYIVFISNLVSKFKFLDVNKIFAFESFKIYSILSFGYPISIGK